MKKIRLVDQTEIEVYNISSSNDTLVIDILNADASSTEEVFSNPDNLSIIQYYVGTELMKGYSGYTDLREYSKKKGLVISKDYSIPDSATESGFAEETADVLTIYLDKPSKISQVADQAEQNAADIAYLAMESGVDL